MKKKEKPKKKKAGEKQKVEVESNVEEIPKRLLEKIISDIAGPEGENLVNLLYKKQNVNEFFIAKKMDLTINQTRNMLYKLADEGIVGFIRKKDKKKGGWYIYFWTLRAKKTLSKSRGEIEEIIKELENKLEKLQRGRYFYCKNCETEYTEEEAMLHDFTCQECGEIMEIKDTMETKDNIRKEIEKIKETSKKMEIEIENLEIKEQKSRERRQKIELKKKEIERKRKRMEREKEKAKLNKKSPKKQKKKLKKKPKVKKKSKGKKKKPAKKPKKNVSKKKRRKK